jgi:uncharacterized membrane protein YhaH (DUF805 family)
MAHNPKQNYNELWKRAVWGTLTFRGRSSRTELIAYYFSTILAGLVFMLVLLPFGLIKFGSYLPEIITLIIAIPLPALIYRRLQDHNMSGLWIMSLIPSFSWQIIYNIYNNLPWNAHVKIEWWSNIIGFMSFLILLFFTLRQGTNGENRFGPDPRLNLAY